MSDMGKIVKHHSLKHADLILAELRKIWPKTWEGWLRCWANGREQGYHLTVIRWDDKRGERSQAACVFAEGRSCDGALVVIGPKSEFKEFGGLSPSDKLWDAEGDENRRYFYDTTGLHDKNGGCMTWDKSLLGRGNELAAKWIVKRFRNLLAEDLKEFRKMEKEHAKAKKARAS